MNATAVTCVLVDLDNTLSHFIGKGGSKGFFGVFTPHGIPEIQCVKCYESVKTDGFSLKKFLNELTTRGVALVSRALLPEQLEKDFNLWLRRSLVLYPDSLPALALWQKHHIPVCIVTAGDETFQREKIELLHLPHDAVVVLPHTGEKTSVIKTILVQFGPPVALIDDKENELDAVRATYTEENVRTIHVGRMDSPYRGQVPQCEHHEATNLVEAAVKYTFNPPAPFCLHD